MYKLVIVDDEIFIVRLIEKLIDHDRLDIEVVGTTTDSMEALKMVREFKADILITDIKMPCMDGLALIDHLNKSGLPVSIIAISGYRRFDYAYSALKGGVEDYLVKPIGRKDLNNALEKLCRKLSSRRDESDNLKQMEERVAESAKSLRRKLILDSLGHSARTEDIDQINRDYMYRFAPGYFAGVAIRIDLPQSGAMNGPILQNCFEKMREVLGEICIDMEFVRVDELFCGICNTSAEATHQLMRRVKVLFEQLTLTLEPYETASVSIGLGSILSDCGGIASTIGAAKVCACAKCILGGNRIYYSERLDWENLSKQISPVQVENLRKILEVDGADQLRPWLDSVFSEPASYYVEHPIEALSLIQSVQQNFTMLCSMLAFAVDADAKKAYSERLYRCCSLAESKECLHDSMLQIVQGDQKHRMQRDSYPVQCAKEYIEKNLSTPLALKDIADHVMFNPNYLSKLFKDETGQGISEYILQLRLDQAKLLLRSTNLNINQIADRVGYQDAKHFSKLFKKMMGVRMQDYRKMYSR